MKKLMLILIIASLFLVGCSTQQSEKVITNEEKEEIKKELKEELREEVKQEIKEEMSQNIETQAKKEEIEDEELYVIYKFDREASTEPAIVVSTDPNGKKDDENSRIVIVSEETYNEKEIGDTFQFKKREEE